MRWFRLLFRYTLNNVICGITLMVLVALYVAMGSGLPSVREFFEMSDLEFFNAWPLKLLMLALCLNLAVVTWNRIPLTPPRYGVWCIHAGIITLILGTSLYYHFKVEGKTLIPIGHTINVYYDSDERALYARVLNRGSYGMHPLPSLPRFGTYDADHHPQRLRRPDLTSISKFIPIGFQTDSSNDLSQWLGLSDEIKLDIVGFHSYADVVDDVIPDPASDDVGIQLKIDGPHPDMPASTVMLNDADPTAAHQFVSATEFEYRRVSPSSLADIQRSVGELFQLSATLGSNPSQTLTAGIGSPIPSAPPDYNITVDSYNPAFPMFGTHEPVQALTLHIVSTSPAPQREFWRMILAGKTLQTDFKMDPATTPPFVKGNRQSEPIDKNLVLQFRVLDPAALLPTGGDDKHVLLTAGPKQVTDIHISFSAPTQVTDLTGGGKLQLLVDGSTVTARVSRMDHFKILSRVVETPAARQIKDQAEAGIKQVAEVRVTAGSWSQDIAIPCDLYPAPDPMTLEPLVPWAEGVVRIPGAAAPLQLQLGFTCRNMPAALTLQKFELIHYPGGEGDQGPFRDFRSTLQIIDNTGDRNTAVASLNDPIYYDGGQWIFFQAGYEPDGQSSTIGVGNRPGVLVMITGCIMIVVGLMYAFYLKPIVIRRMKAAALARAARPDFTTRNPQLAESKASP